MGCGESKDQKPIKVDSASSDRVPNLTNREARHNEILEVIDLGDPFLDRRDPQRQQLAEEEDDDLGGTDSSSIHNIHSIYTSDLGESLDLRRGGSGPGLEHKNNKASASSYDSIDSGVYELDDEYSFVITELSSPELIARVERDFLPPSEELDLTILGVTCKRLLSGSQKTRLEEQEVLETLRNEGLLAVTTSKKPGSLCFEIVDANASLSESMRSDTLSRLNSSAQPHLPPLKLQSKLEARRRQHQREISSNTDIEIMLQKAEDRRKQVEEQKVKRLNIERVELANSRVEGDRIEKVTKANQQVEGAENNRETRLKELRDKLKEKHTKVAHARLRAQTHKESLGPTPKPILQGVSGPRGIIMDDHALLRPSIKIGSHDAFFDD
ncbi:unnamed protein product [Notodromas monacha]|uniref:Uncharacterized protein n=1 Tax=Notodromas monacha TaxID=399045 RepID=A0A7R9GC39_9CRUS|nr:unnamed protein product [Notodromas monacha]CAG0917074.1 unnamed protein product [Notodromas monacha]